MRPVARWIATFGLGLLAVYCAFALLFTAGGYAFGNAGEALLMWFGVVGSVVAVWRLVPGKANGQWVGVVVYLVGTVYYIIGALVSKRPSGDRIFLVAIAAANALGVWALYERPLKSKP